MHAWLRNFEIWEVFRLTCNWTWNLFTTWFYLQQNLICKRDSGILRSENFSDLFATEHYYKLKLSYNLLLFVNKSYLQAWLRDFEIWELFRLICNWTQSSLLPCRLILLNPKFKFDFACDATTFLYYVTKGRLPKKEKIKIRLGFPCFQIIQFLFFSLPCGKRND